MAYIRLAALLSVLVLWAATATAGSRSMVFLPQWQPQAQFAGYYAALDKGFYAARGLDVTILTGGPDEPPSRALEQARADVVSMFLSTAISLRSTGAELVNIGQIVHQSSLMLVARKSAGIDGLKDLQGKKVSVWGAEYGIQPKALFEQAGLRVRTIPQGTTVNLFLEGGVAAAAAMWYNEYHLILNAGYDPGELTTIFFKDTDFGFPEDGLYCRAAYARRNPELLADFVAASLEGWQYAFAHPEEAVDMVLVRARAAGVATNRAHQHWMLERMRDIIDPDGDGRLTTELTRGVYEHVAEVLRRGGITASIPDYDRFVRNRGAREVEP